MQSGPEPFLWYTSDTPMLVGVGGINIAPVTNRFAIN